MNKEHEHILRDSSKKGAVCDCNKKEKRLPFLRYGAEGRKNVV